MESKVTSAGDTTVIECMTAGNPRPRLEWRKDSKPLRATLRHFFTADDQLLIIVQTSREDAGEYTCIMTNALGSERQTSRVTVVEDESGSLGGETEDQTTGIVIIAVVCCVVGTSLIWVIVIYQTRRRRRGRGKERGGICCPHSEREEDGVCVVGVGEIGRTGRPTGACYRHTESIGNNSAQQLICPTQGASFTSMQHHTLVQKKFGFG